MLAGGKSLGRGMRVQIGDALVAVLHGGASGRDWVGRARCNGGRRTVSRRVESKHPVKDPALAEREILGNYPYVLLSYSTEFTVIAVTINI